MRNLGFVEFADYFGRVSLFFSEGYIRKLILPSEKNKEIGSKEPQIRQNLGYARGLFKSKLTTLARSEAIPIVFLHGFLGSSEDWIPVCKALPPCSYVCLDLPGHGASPFTKDFTKTMPDFPKMHLIGYSMGGRLAMQYAEAFPDKIASLTIFSAHTGLKNLEEKQKRLLLDFGWAEKIRKSFDDFLSEWYDQPIFAGFKPNLEMRRNQNPESLALSLMHYSLGNQNLLYPRNALFVVGERDQKYRQLYPEAQIVPNAGHMVHLENPEAVANIIKRNISL